MEFMESKSQEGFPTDDQQRIKIPKKNSPKNNIKKSKIKFFSAATGGRGTCFPVNPFNCSALLNDPNIKELAEQAEEYPSFNQMAGQDGIPKSHYQKYRSTMIRIIKNSDCWTLAKSLSNALMQDPSMSSMLEIYANQPWKGQRKWKTADVNKDPCFKLILDDIENGGPAAMMRYWNDEKVLKMFGLVMGIPTYSGNAVVSPENSGPDESIVHHTATIGSVKLRCWDLKERCQQPSVSPIVTKLQMQIGCTHEESSLVLFMLKLNLLDLLFRRGRYVHVPYYWHGYARSVSSNSRVKSSTSTDNLPDQETQGVGIHGLLTILSRLMVETPSVRFAQEFVLVLLMYHCLCNMPRNQFDTASYFPSSGICSSSLSSSAGCQDSGIFGQGRGILVDEGCQNSQLMGHFANGLYTGAPTLKPRQYIFENLY